MKTLTSAQVRQMFLDFFKEKGHAVEPSASLIPHEDPYGGGLFSRHFQYRSS